MSKKLLSAGVILVVVAAGILGYFEYAKRQPRYAIFKLIAACQARDVAAFHRYVNLDAVVSQTMNGLQRATQPGLSPSQGEVPQLGAALQEGIMRLVVPGLAKQVAGSLDAAVAGGNLAYLQLCGGGSGLFHFSGDTCTVTVDSVTRQGETATVAVTVQDTTGAHPVRLNLGLRPWADSWQVVAVYNWQELLAGIPSLLRN